MTDDKRGPEKPQKPAELQEGNSPPEAPTSPENPSPAPEDANDDDRDTFDRAYVDALRKSDADHRVKAKRADTLAARLLTSSIESATRGILADSSDLLANVANEADLLDDDGYPDPEKIKAAAKALTASKPHLADRRPAGEVDQGARPETKNVNLADLVRARA